MAAVAAPFQQSEAVLRALIESPQRIVIFALDAQYHYLAFNNNHARTMRQIWGVDISVGANMLDLIGRSDDRAKARANFDRVLAGESFTLIEEYGDTRMERRFYEDVYSPVRDSEGRITGVAVYLTDITEHRRVELELEDYRNHLEDLVQQRTRELESAHAQLLRAQKLESLGVLAGGIAHDFNNLLAVILARAELCLRELPDGTGAVAHLPIIRDAALEARMLTKQLLNYAGKGRFVLEDIELNGVVRGMEQLVRASISKVIRLSFELSDGQLPVAGDATQLRQVVLNLVTNAAEAIGSRVGVIRVRTGTTQIAPGSLRATCLPSSVSVGHYAYLEVEDDGCGIADEHRDKIFDPFFSTKFAGHGLGLAAVLGITKSHGGAIVLDSRPQGGSCFRVLLPQVDNPLRSGSVATAVGSQVLHGSGCVLVVDDEAPVRQATSELLRSMGYDVLEADGGVAALALFRERGEDVDAVLLDLAMPEMNGEQVLRELKKLRAQVPIVLLTAYAEDESRVRFSSGELAGFIAKPFAREELAGVLGGVVRKPAGGEPTRVDPSRANPDGDRHGGK